MVLHRIKDVYTRQSSTQQRDWYISILRIVLHEGYWINKI